MDFNEDDEPLVLHKNVCFCVADLEFINMLSRIREAEYAPIVFPEDED
jgi:hypothetical protein